MGLWALLQGRKRKKLLQEQEKNAAEEKVSSLYFPTHHESDLGQISANYSHTEGDSEAARAMGYGYMEGYPEVIQAMGHGRNITLELNFNGQKATKRTQIIDKLVIGRHKDGVSIDIETDPNDRTVFRPHCELVLQNDQLYVRNLSRSSQGTLLNGRKVTGTQTQIQDTGADAEALNPDAQPMMNTSGMEQVMSGDEITIGQHRIKISYQWG